MTSLAAIAHQPRVLEQAYAALTDRLLALLRHDNGVPAATVPSRTAAAVVGAIIPVALYLALVASGLSGTIPACVGTLPV
jgi:hypothetical protein